MAGAAGGFVTRAFDSMLKECSGKKYTSLQTAIQSYLDGIKEGNQQAAVSESAQKSEHNSDESHGQSSERNEQAVKPVRANVSIATTLSNAGHKLEGAQAELVLNPLRLAFETKNIKVVEPALDCLHKLIAYDHLEGDPGLDHGENAALFADILSIVCSSVDNSSSDSTTLQVLKVLITAVASAKFRVHGEPLLGVIRACYSIALNSKSPMNQVTSKAMLTQMISIVFRRMESDLSVSNVLEVLQNNSSSSSIAHTEDTSTSGSKTGFEVGSVDDQNEKGMTEADAVSQNSVEDASIASIEELQNLASSADTQGLEAIMDKAVNLEDVNRIKNDIDLESMSIGHRDALLVFRTLCKMGMKEDSDDIATKTRILSLELLQGLLEGVSDALTKNFHFLNSVKAYLSYALLRASVSSSPVIFQHTAGIFAVLLLRFRKNLKGEIGILFPLIVLRYLDNADNQRLSVLRMLEKVCKDPQMLIDLYVNYDCDLSAPNLFERMVKTLSKIAQGTHSSDPNSVAASQNDSVKGSSLQCLVNMLKSLVNRERSRKDSEKRNTGGSSLGNELSEVVEKETRVEVSDDFEKEKARKSIVEAAIAEFNRQPGKGIEYLVANKLVENTPASVADFLKSTSDLDEALVGDYLGQHEEFPRSVMHAYVDSMNFSGMTFDAAIREFLSGFRLPREAQKIDRIVEKFSERYCADNLNLFENADTAYVLAYAVLMLNTNAHNPMVSSKMSKADFIHMNSTADAEEMPPKELLAEIYDSIVKEEIKFKDDPDSTPKSAKQKSEADERGRLVSILNLTLPRRKSVDKKSESDAIIKRTQAIFRNQGAKRGVFHTSHKVELIRPMVEAVGWSLLATFSVIMEEGDNKSRVLLCMEGFKAGIHITHVLEMDTMRYAFLTSLVRFTFLHAPKDMRSKNVEALRTLLELCDSDTNSLVDSWNAVLECISRLELITSSPSISATVGSNQNPRDAVVPSLRELAGKPTEQVFLNSTKLPSDGIVEFFTALCGVSAEELKQTPARVFSLQKLVEISYYNMARIRLVWARIWVVLSNHFVSAGSHHDEKVALYAIDSLRQLGMKYLERAELANFTFQNDIVKPFVALMRNSRSETTRKLIVDYIVQMIKSKVATIKSGWRSVFMIFMAAADDDSETIVESAFENVEQVILEHFDQVIAECFLDCVNCLIGFANNKSSHRMSLKAIALLRICENRLAEGLVPGGALNHINKSRNEEFDVTEHYWFPMLAGLSDLTSDTRAEVRNCALEVLFDLLNERGSKFSSSFWESIFRRVLFPIFDHVRHAGKETSQFSSDDEWLHETCIHSLQLLCNLFNTFYKEVSFMLPPLLSLLLDCAKKTDQSVVSIALGALEHLIEVGGHQFSDNDWDTLLKSIRDASYATQPLELLNDLGFQHSNISNDLGDAKPDGGDGVVNATADDSTKSSRKVDNHDIATISHPDHNNDDDSLQSSASGSSSPSVSSQKPTDSDLQRNQTLGQRIMGNRFLRSLTSKTKDPDLGVSVQSRAQLPEAVEVDSKGEEESPLLTNIRGKCVTQLLLLSAIDSIQKKYWSKLKGQQKVTIMEILVSTLDFAASYNSYSNLRLRMHHIPVERPPMNLLRQELVGTCVYLDILQKTISALEDTKRENSPEVSDFRDLNAEPKLEGVAEEKLVSFCGQVLKDASDFQSSVKGTTNMEIHRVLELRSPIIVKVINGMSSMNSHIFRKHLGEFYPLLTKLLCCEQMAIRGALGDLFRNQLSSLLP